MAKSNKIELPTIHIRRKETGTHESKPLNFFWNLCVLGIKIDKRNCEQFPELWPPILEERLSIDPSYNLDRGLVPEPNWSSLTQNYEDEYFSGNKYALYQRGTEYTVSENGSCELVDEPYNIATIDNGECSYIVDFIGKTATKNLSEVIIKKKIDAQYKEIVTDNPIMTKSMINIMSQVMIGKDDSTKQKKSLQEADKINNLTKVVGSEVVAGEACEYLAID